MEKRACLCMNYQLPGMDFVTGITCIECIHKWQLPCPPPICRIAGNDLVMNPWVHIKPQKTSPHNHLSNAQQRTRTNPSSESELNRQHRALNE